MTDRLWTGGETISSPDQSDGGAAGITTATTVQFQSAGSVTGVQYRAPNTISGTWTIGIWEVTSDDDPAGTGTGTLLDSKNVSVVAGVFQDLMFDAPIPITPLTKIYRIGVWSSAGRYVATAGVFNAADVTSPGGFIIAYRSGHDTVGFGSQAQGTFKADAAFGYPSNTSGQASYFPGPVFEPTGADLNLTDGPGGGTAAGASDTLTVDRVLSDGPGGGTAAGAAEALVVDRVLADGPGGASAGSSANALEINPAVDVLLADAPGGATAAASPDTLVVSSSLADTSVMPILLQILACLQAEMMRVPSPPLNFHIRPGATFQPLADSTRDECCEGIAWVRRGPMFRSRDFPEQFGEADGTGTHQWAMQVELGVERCIPVIGEGSNDPVPLASQWLAAATAAEDDSAALRRTICCIEALLGKRRVIVGQITPLENGGNCGGQIVILTIALQACDC